MLRFFKRKPQYQQPVCAIIGAECPGTNDPDSVLAKSSGRYCPHWVDGIMETHTDNSGRFTDVVFRGCFLSKLPNYLVSVTASASHAAASADKVASIVHKSVPGLEAISRLVLTSSSTPDVRGLPVMDTSPNQLPTSLESNNGAHRGD